MPGIGLNSQYSIINSQLNICHGDRFVPARFGPVGGLSQPRRDTADPKTLTIYYFQFNNLIMCYIQ
jgi:hypothetical protein